MMTAKPKTEKRSPCHFPRSAGGKMSPMIAWAIGIIAPAPRPWIVRNAISWSIVRACPHSIEPPRNTPMPSMYSHFRP